MQKNHSIQPIIILLTAVILFFSFDAFGQTARQRAISLKEEGDKYLSRGEYKPAIDWYLKALEADKEYPDTYSSMGFALSKIHEHKLAAAYYITYWDKVKNQDNIYFVVVFYRIGNEFRLAKEFDRSKEVFDTALKINPKFAPDFEAVSSIYSYRGDLNKAAIYMQKAIDFSNSDSTEDVNRYIGLSWYYSFLQRHQDAVNAATNAIKLNNKEAMAYTNRCRAYNDLKQYDNAISDCNKALNLRPNHGETQYYLANSYRGKGNTTKATELNRTAIPNLIEELKASVNNEDINLHDHCYLLGNALYLEGKFKEAVTIYEAGLEFRSNFPLLRHNLGLAYLKIGNKQAAREQYQELLKVDTEKANSLKKQIDTTK